MRISSNFKDYYDVVQQHGKDEQIFFDRHSNIKANFNNGELHLPEAEKMDGKKLKKIKAFIIAEMIDYPTLSLLRDFNNLQTILSKNGTKKTDSTPKTSFVLCVVNGTPTLRFFITKRKEIDEELKSQLFSMGNPKSFYSSTILSKNLTSESLFYEFKKELENLNLLKFLKQNLPTHLRNGFFLNYDSWEDYVKNNKQRTTLLHFEGKATHISKEEFQKIHKELNTPVFFSVGDTSELTVYVVDERNLNLYKNIPMKMFGLSDVFPSVEELHQEISYCLGNVIQNKNEPPLAVDDKYKIEGHGFDLKQSFRHRK